MEGLQTINTNINMHVTIWKQIKHIWLPSQNYTKDSKNWIHRWVKVETSLMETPILYQNKNFNKISHAFTRPFQTYSSIPWASTHPLWPPYKHKKALKDAHTSKFSYIKNSQLDPSPQVLLKSSQGWGLNLHTHKQETNQEDKTSLKSKTHNETTQYKIHTQITTIYIFHTSTSFQCIYKIITW